MAATEYIVFKKLDGPADEHWGVAGTYKASSSPAAIRDAALDLGDGTYAAVPGRSWQPAAFKVQPRAVAVKPA